MKPGLIGQKLSFLVRKTKCSVRNNFMSIARLPLICAAASIAIFSVNGQGTISINSSISQVTVYLDRARVTRAANARVPAGSSTIEFAGLPATLDEGSVSVSAKSDGALTI